VNIVQLNTRSHSGCKAAEYTKPSGQLQVSQATCSGDNNCCIACDGGMRTTPYIVGMWHQSGGCSCRYHAQLVSLIAWPGNHTFHHAFQPYPSTIPSQDGKPSMQQGYQKGPACAHAMFSLHTRTAPKTTQP
jgi:hypothetical protein